MHICQARNRLIVIKTQNIISNLRSNRINLLSNGYLDSELLQDIHHQIDQELESINQSIQNENRINRENGICWNEHELKGLQA